MTWHPIETAPRDGQYVWVYMPGALVPQTGRPSRLIRKAHRMVAARWVSAINPPKGYTVSDRTRLLLKKHGGFWTGHPIGLEPTKVAPTHWMPLPEPPDA